MDVFDLRESLIDEYSGFARSFTSIRSPDLREPVSEAYAGASIRGWSTA